MTTELETKTCRVLIVEDNITFRETLRGILYSRFPFLSFEELGDGKGALTKVKDFLPDLIFMDIKLPGESGLELTRKIKGSYPEIPIIILTNYDFPEYREVARQNGADYFFVKGSSTAEEILEWVDSLLSGHGQGPMEH